MDPFTMWFSEWCLATFQLPDYFVVFLAAMVVGLLAVIAAAWYNHHTMKADREEE